MKTYVLLLLGIFLSSGCAIDPTAGLASSPIPPEKWSVDFGSKRWKVGSHESTRTVRIIEYVPEGQTVEAWREIVTDQFIVARFPTTTKFIEVSLQDLSRQVDGFESKVIYDTGAEALYEWWHRDSGRWPAEHQLTLIKYYPTGMLGLSYARKGPKMSDEEKAVWIERFKNAKLR